MNRRDHPRPTGARRPGRRLILLALTVVLAGCGSGADTAISTGSPEIGTPASPTTTAGSGAGVAPGSGNAASRGNPSATTSSPTAGGGPAVAVELGGPLLFTPSLLLSTEEFGEVAAGAASPPHTLQMRSPLEYRATIVALEPAGASFRISEDRCTGVTLPPAGSGACTIAVTFSPSEAGQATGGISIRMTHTCTSATHVPCSWTPEQIEAPGTAPNFTRVVLPGGEVRFDWTAPLLVRLVGQGIDAAADPATPPTT
jgi:hypothetical protein